MRRLFYSDVQSDRISLGLLLLRVVVGAAFMFHGLPKIKNPTDWMNRETTDVHGSLQAAAAVSEFAGGALLILGLFTRVAATATGVTMAVAVGIVHLSLRHPFVAQKPGEPSCELAAVYLACSLLLVLAGAGRFSLDAVIFGRPRVVRDASRPS